MGDVTVGRRRGYTMIEMVVAMIIIGIMTAAVGVGTKTLLDDSESRSAESNVQRLLLAEQRFAVRNGSYTAYVDDLGELKELTATNEASHGPEEVSVALGVDGTLGLAVLRDTDECVLVRAARLEGSGAAKSWKRTDTPCTGAEALPSTEAEDLDAPSTSRSRG